MLIHTLLVDSIIETEHISVFVGVAIGGQQVTYLSLPGDVVSRVHELQTKCLVFYKLVGFLLSHPSMFLLKSRHAAWLHPSRLIQ